MSSEWNEYAEGWDVDPSVQEYASKAFAEISSVLSLDGLSIFDFGCGTGTLAGLLSAKARSIVALDSSPEMVRILAGKSVANVSTIAGELTRELIDSEPRLADGFDLAVASSVCGFLPDYETTLGLLKSLLKRGGVFIQFDWLADESGSGIGLSEARVRRAMLAHAFGDIQLRVPFAMVSSKGTMAVLMATGRNP